MSKYKRKEKIATITIIYNNGDKKESNVLGENLADKRACEALKLEGVKEVVVDFNTEGRAPVVYRKNPKPLNTIHSKAERECYFPQN